MTTRREILAYLGAMAAAPGSVGARRIASWLARYELREVDVRQFGARGDGATDDTHAFQLAIQALPSAGGRVLVPEGTYMIDALKSVRLRDGVRLELAAVATLKAIPVAASSSAVIRCENVHHIRVRGGRIVGERTHHLGTRGEWGMGVLILGCSDVILQDVDISDCWGDG